MHKSHESHDHLRLALITTSIYGNATINNDTKNFLAVRQYTLADESASCG